MRGALFQCALFPYYYILPRLSWPAISNSCFVHRKAMMKPRLSRDSLAEGKGISFVPFFHVKIKVSLGQRIRNTNPRITSCQKYRIDLKLHYLCRHILLLISYSHKPDTTCRSNFFTLPLIQLL